MIYGTTNVHRVRDITDLIGIRVLLLRQRWQPTATGGILSEEELDAQKPAAPGVAGGLMLMGEQTLKERGHYSTIWTFQGINGDGKSVTFRDRTNSLDYGFDPGFAQVPIQVHPRFTTMLEENEGSPSNDGTTVIWSPKLSSSNGTANGLTIKTPSGNTIGGGGGLLDEDPKSSDTNPMYGIQEYFELEGVYRFRYAAKALPGNLLTGVGRIASSLPGEPPAVTGGRNWLKAPAAYQRKGVVFDITEFYWLSRRGGWPKPVYS